MIQRQQCDSGGGRGHHPGAVADGGGCRWCTRQVDCHSQGISLLLSLAALCRSLCCQLEPPSVKQSVTFSALLLVPTSQPAWDVSYFLSGDQPDKTTYVQPVQVGLAGACCPLWDRLCLTRALLFLQLVAVEVLARCLGGGQVPCLLIVRNRCILVLH